MRNPSTFDPYFDTTGQSSTTPKVGGDLYDVLSITIDGHLHVTRFWTERLRASDVDSEETLSR